jgi:hypothetical protein
MSLESICRATKICSMKSRQQRDFIILQNGEEVFYEITRQA